MFDLTCDVDAFTTDPGLLKKHSSLKNYSAAGFQYPSIRTFYHPHIQADKLPTKPTALPLLVFVHGLGGGAAQFGPLLTSLINAAPCLAMDLPGCGLSDFAPKDLGAYRTSALARLLAVAIQQHRDVENEQKVILIGHSMGCSLAAMLASSTSPLYHLMGHDIAGFIALCPRAEAPTLGLGQRLAMEYMPLPVFDLFRAYDRRGGVESASVIRYTGKDADEETKRLQLRFNEQSQSDVFFAMAAGLVPQDSNNGNVHDGMPGKTIWSGIEVPLFLIAGELDHVCPPINIEMISKWLDHHTKTSVAATVTNTSLPAAAGEIPTADFTGGERPETRSSGDVKVKKPSSELLSETRQTAEKPTARKPVFVLKTTVFPAPASHALPYQSSTVRILSGLLQSFLATHIDHRLSLGWQLQHLTTEGKWDVKNLQKWQKVQPVSPPIANVFRGMKTLREVDEEHTPTVFVKKWAAKNDIPQGVRMVVDISHESPVYDPKGLEDGQIEYHKFPTVSKLPPTVDEVRAYIALIDALRAQIAKEEDNKDATIGTHCHYGYNRTGFFVVCYMVERLGYQVQDAIDEFAEKRAPGIRHEHFINELFVRYAVGLKRRPTICD
ncbi:hypothetical protein AAFC00_000467 [Neodothiora populina]|uniref:Tyrosine specific protein phosphatases domain-containing protein n=1 Tax=Neodothiora populina TaxID=2781224 RepID=A0ABR3PD15_9PEZI